MHFNALFIIFQTATPFSHIFFKHQTKPILTLFSPPMSFKQNTVTLLLPRDATVADALEELRSHVQLSSPTAPLRMMEIFHHRIYKIFQPHEPINTINDQYWTIRAEVIAFDDYVTLGGEQAAKDAGKWRLEGKEYIVKDGDVIHFRFNV